MSEAEEKGHGTSAAHHGSIWPLVAGFGAAIGYAGLVTSTTILGLGIIVFAAGVGGWIRDDLRSPSSPFYGSSPETPGVVRVSARKLATWVFLATEAMFFTPLIRGSAGCPP